MEKVVIADAVRTPIGAFAGALGSLPASSLGQLVIEALLRRTGVRATQISEVIIQLHCG